MIPLSKQFKNFILVDLPYAVKKERKTKYINVSKSPEAAAKDIRKEKYCDCSEWQSSAGRQVRFMTPSLSQIIVLRNSSIVE